MAHVKQWNEMADVGESLWRELFKLFLDNLSTDGYEVTLPGKGHSQGAFRAYL